jgi:hypothetical protein
MKMHEPLARLEENASARDYAGVTRACREVLPRTSSRSSLGCAATGKADLEYNKNSRWASSGSAWTLIES